MADWFTENAPKSAATDWFAQNAPSAQPEKPAMQQPQGSAAGRAAGGFWDTTLGGLGKAAKMVYHFATPLPGGMPNLDALQDANELLQAHIDQAKKAKEAWEKGEHTEAVGHGMAAALPLIGPAAAHAGERIGGSAPQFDKYGNVVQPGQAPDVAGGLGEAAGLIVSSSPKNIVGPVSSKAAAVLKKAVPERMTPERMYQSSLRPSLSKKNLPKIDKEVQTGLREGIPVSRGGAEKLDTAMQDVNADIAGKIAAKSAQLGPDINPLDVTKPVNRLRPTFENQVNPDTDLAAIKAAKREFLDKHSTKAPYTQVAPNPYAPPGQAGMVPVGKGVVKTKQPLTLSEAQAEKQGTYRQLSKKYGELGSADVEAQKALARGLKDEIAKRVPEISELNARDSALIDLQRELERMVAREGNKNLLGLVPATMSHNPFGFLATLMLDNPAIKSRVAIALDRARKLTGKKPPIAPVTGPASVAGATANQQQEIPRYGKGGIAGLHGPELALVGEEGPENITPLSADLPTVPEKPATLKAQLEQLAAGDRKVVMFPHGTPLLKRPKIARSYQDENGNRYIFNPKLTSQREIDAAIQNNSLPDLLGAAEGGMGAPDKAELSPDAVAVVGSDKKGTTTQATATDRQHMARTVKQTKKLTPKGGKVSVESPAKELRRRMDLAPPEPPGDNVRPRQWYDRRGKQMWFHGKHA